MGRRPSSNGNGKMNTLIAAERRRRICEWVEQNGSANVADLAEALDVAVTTIRNDLRSLDKEGKLVRSYGGAVVKDSATSRLPYSQTRGENIEQKALIAEAALAYLPSSGCFFIGPGSTTFQLAERIPQDRQLRVVTNSFDVATHLAANNVVHVEFLGGTVRADSLSTDIALPEENRELFYWDVTFMGAAAIDPARGITTLDLAAARWERYVMERACKTVVLCDSSKLGRFSFAKIGPVSLIDVLITDSGGDEGIIESIRSQGVDVVTVENQAD